VETITSSNANGASVGYTYDGLNRLSTVTDSRLQGEQTTTYTYDPASNVATVSTPNGLQSSFTYDQLNRLTGMNSSISGGWPRSLTTMRVAPVPRFWGPGRQATNPNPPPFSDP